MIAIPSLFSRLCDDAAMFPPGNAPFSRAVSDHFQHLESPHADLMGPFVLPADKLPGLTSLLAGRDEGSLDIAVTAALNEVASVLARAADLPGAELMAIEVSVPKDSSPASVVDALDTNLGGARPPLVFVEIPRDDRRSVMIRALAGTGFRAKFRTGGVRMDDYPDVNELADTILTAVAAEVEFKATAGLHHAIRNDDPRTGASQHGFLNLIAAADAARSGERADVVEQLAERQPDLLTERIHSIDHMVRRTFLSFGTCSIDEPVNELTSLGLLEPVVTGDLR